MTIAVPTTAPRILPAPQTDWAPTIALALLSAFAFFTPKLLRRRFLQQTHLSPPDKAPTTGDLPGPLLAESTESPPLFSTDERSEMVFAIDRYTDEDTPIGIDWDRSVGATARAMGEPTLIPAYARYPRSVWLWIDEGTSAPLIDRTAEELAAELRRANLTVEIARFNRSLATLRFADSALAVPPWLLESQRDRAIVAILTDGAGILPPLRRRALAESASRSSSPGRSLHTPRNAWAEDDPEEILRGLARWPRLAIFDPVAPDDSASRWADYGLRCYPLMHLPAFLSHRSHHARQMVSNPIDRDALHLWAAALMFAPFDITEDDALRLRERLQIGDSTFVLADVLGTEDDRRRYAADPAAWHRRIPPAECYGRRYRFDSQTKSREQRWLMIAAPELCAIAVNFWQQRVTHDIEFRKAREDNYFLYKGTRVDAHRSVLHAL